MVDLLRYKAQARALRLSFTATGIAVRAVRCVALYAGQGRSKLV